MAGHVDGHEPLKLDRGFEQFNKWVTTAQYRFKYTAKNVPIIILLAAAVPGALCYAGYQSQGYMERKPRRRTHQIHEREYKLP